ncbi:uncharacterized protein M6B38_132235 [Iris pallida]|uniref:BHLH domain-containing protein n=1 Tax=Iris pallida TaxID=29817 RepID=A0AAX6FRF8_IRIPA|nr:uncharacterized protein M6B38_132235 [Iris pallida]
MMRSSATNDGSSSKVDRKTVEKNRRIHMKNLCFKLGSLVPKEEKNTKDAISLHDHLDQATTYIRNLKARIEKLKQRRKIAAGDGESTGRREADCEIADEPGLPVLNVRCHDSILEVVLITGRKKKFMFYQVMGVLVEEGAQVVNASFSVVSDKTFYTIHSQATSSSSMIGLDVSKISERLKKLIQVTN